MLKAINSLDIVREARAWVGTPFKLQGRLKQKGCDCLGLIMGVSRVLDLKNKHGASIASLDYLEYHLHFDGSKLEDMLERNFYNKPDIRNLAMGDLILFNYDSLRHLAIAADHLHAKFSIIHADIRARAVVEHILDASLERRLNRIYKLI